MNTFKSNIKSLLPVALAASVIAFSASVVYIAGDIEFVSTTPLTKQEQLQLQQEKITTMLDKMKADAKRIRESTPTEHANKQAAKQTSTNKASKTGDSQ